MISSQISKTSNNLHIYNQDFYQSQAKGSLHSAQEIVPLVIDFLEPTSVIDIGCGIGTWLSVFQEHGIEDIQGIDGNFVNPENLLISQEKFTSFDLTKGLKINRKFDLAMSLEVAEHLSEECSDIFIDCLTNLSSIVMFSAAIPFQAGVEHVNEQWQDYWQKKFQNRGYVAIDYLRSKIWNNPKIQYWYAQNTMLYVETKYLEANNKIQAEYKGQYSPISIIHPKNYERFANPDNLDLRQIGLKRILMSLPMLMLNSVCGRINLSK